MSATATELAESREITTGRNPSAELTYFVQGATAEADALSAVSAAAPSIFQGLVRQSVSVAPIGDPSEDGNWRGTARYGSANFTAPRETGESVYAYDTGGGSRNLKTSLSTTSYPTGAAPNHGGLINVRDGEVAGVDAVVPVFNFQETHYLSNVAAGSTFRTAVYNLTGKVNNATFKGLSAGECLFLGASGTVRGNDEDWEITLRFAASPNRSGLTIAGISGISVGGWQYVWVETKREEQTISGETRLVDVGQFVHVETIYDSGDFSPLDI